MHSKTRVMLLVAVFLLAACGDAPFAELGRVDEWVDAGAGEETDTEAPTTTVPANVARPIGDIVWYNGWAREVPSEPNEVISMVWGRTDGLDAYVQTSPNEIAAALPGLMIPGEVAPGVKFVTSQLVYARSKGNLTNYFVAAFGFWRIDPYTASSQVGQVATLKVATEQEVPRDITDPTGGCGRFADRDVTSCDALEINGHPAWWIISLDGENLVLLQDQYRYEFTLRPNVARATIEAMATSMVPMASVSPSEATLALEPVGGGVAVEESSG